MKHLVPYKSPISLNLAFFIITAGSVLFSAFFIYKNWMLQQKLKALSTTIIPSENTICQKGQTKYECGSGITKIVENTPGAGVSYQKTNGKTTNCPVVSPNYISSECKELNQLECSLQTCSSL